MAKLELLKETTCKILRIFYKPFVSISLYVVSSLSWKQHVSYVQLSIQTQNLNCSVQADLHLCYRNHSTEICLKLYIFLIDFCPQSLIPFYIVSYLHTCANTRILSAKGFLQQMPVHVFKLNCHSHRKGNDNKRINK